MHRLIRHVRAVRTTRAATRLLVTLSLAGALLAGLLLASPDAGAKHAPSNPPTGFSQPYAGPAQYESQAPTALDNQGQLNQPIGQPPTRSRRRSGSPAPSPPSSTSSS
jgi:hypothetical protein